MPILVSSSACPTPTKEECHYNLATGGHYLDWSGANYHGDRRFYNNLFGQALEREYTLDLGLLGIPCRDLSHLEVEFVEKEVEKVVKAMPLDKVPGPDGFTCRFFSTCWHSCWSKYIQETK